MTNRNWKILFPLEKQNYLSPEQLMCFKQHLVQLHFFRFHSTGCPCLFFKYVTVLFLQFISLLPPVTRHKTSVISPLNNCRVVSSFPRLRFQSKFANISLKVDVTHLLLSLWLACDLQASFSEENVIFQALIGNNGLPFSKMFLVLATQNYIGFLAHV